MFETRHRRKDGTVIDVEVSTTGAEIDGQYYLYASSRDITERKHAEKTLEIARAREAEALQELRVMLDISGEGFWKADTSGYILEVNDAYCAHHRLRQKTRLSARISPSSRPLNRLRKWSPSIFGASSRWELTALKPSIVIVTGI